MCMHVFTLCVCVRKTKREVKRHRGQKAVMIWENKVIMGWESLAMGLTEMDKVIIEAS